MIYKKPVIAKNDIWANGTNAIIDEPSTEKIRKGFFFTEIPTVNTVNWMENLYMGYFAYINQVGIPEYLHNYLYFKGSVVNDLSAGKIYISEQDNNLGNPLVPPYWREITNSLSNFRDVEINNLAQKEILVYDSNIKKFVNKTPNSLDIFIDKNDRNGYLGHKTTFCDIDDEYISSKITPDLFDVEFSVDKILKYINKKYFKEINNIKKSSKDNFGIFESKDTLNGFEINSNNQFNESNSEIKYNNESVFTRSGQWVVPSGINQIKIDFSGGGGGGGISSKTGFNGVLLGGGSGHHKSITLQVQENDVIYIEIGLGGYAGSDGQRTVIKHNSNMYISKGGKTSSYKGNGLINEYQKHDGIFIGFENEPNYSLEWVDDWDYWVNGYGGEASQKWHGGSRTGQIAFYGAGGAAISDNTNIVMDNKRFGKGGDGYAIIYYN